MTKYFLKLNPGAKVSKIERCAVEIAIAIRAYSNPIIRIIPEEGVVSLEMITSRPEKVDFSELLLNLKESSHNLPIILGTTQTGDELIVDLSIMPHLLIAGTTGSGKSVMLHSIISSLIGSKSNVKLALVDPKNVELSSYSGVSQLMYPVVTSPSGAADILSDLIVEMETRFAMMAKQDVTSIVEFNFKSKKEIPYIVLIIDEFSALMNKSSKVFQKELCILAQKSRACGIHIVMATQRPSADVVTGLIKANFPARISCRVSSAIDSRVILGTSGAERLLGCGDSIINSIGYDMIRFQGAFTSKECITNICDENERSFLSRVRNILR